MGYSEIIGFNESERRKLEGGLRTKGIYKTSTYDKPLFSIITVVFNGEKYIEETIQSVFNQKYKNIEYIVIEGGSLDSTLNLIRKYEHAIDYWVSEKDQGIYDAMNKGIEQATGEWINFMNAGDLLSYIPIEVMRNINDKVGLIYGKTKLRSGKILNQKIVDVSDFNGGMAVCHQSCFYKKPFYKSFKYEINYEIIADQIFTRECLLKFDSVFVPQTISEYLDDGVSSKYSLRVIREKVRYNLSNNLPLLPIFKSFIRWWAVYIRDFCISVIQKYKIC